MTTAVDRISELPVGTATMEPPRRLGAGRSLEYLSMVLIILGLGGASGVTWKALEGPARLTEPQNSRPGKPLGYNPAGFLRLIPESESAASPSLASLLGDAIDGCLDEPEPDDVIPLAAPSPPPQAEVRVMPGKDPSTNKPVASESRRVRVGDERGRSLVARVYGGVDSRVVLLPDGRLGWPNGMVYTEEPFRPLTPDELVSSLQEGAYKHFQVQKTDHYIIFHTCSVAFARQSGTLLESLYRGLSKAFRERGIDAHEAEFPLVAVIFRNETEFREHKEVAREVQAYYEVLSNRIFFYETRDSEPESPELAAMRKPQTVAHEGTHQILQNIGVQPRLARWPIWLVEGLAEFCAPTGTIRGEWAGFGKLNPFHLATIQDLEDPMSIQGRSARLTRNRIGRAPGRATVEYLLSREDLSPTDYSLSWALTHFLATKRYDEFIAYLKEMSQVPPMAIRTSDQHLHAFRSAFGRDLHDVGKHLHRYVSSLKRFEPLPYFALTFEQPLGDGLVRRGTIVSQSPFILRQWLEQMAEGFDAPYEFQPFVFTSRTAAFQAAEQWINAR